MPHEMLAILVGPTVVAVVGGTGPVPGDHGVAAWAIAGGYLAAAMLCARRLAFVCALGRVRHRTRALALWCLLALGLVALGINKQVDAQMWLTRLGRTIAAEQGWYAQRRVVQAAFVACLVLVLTAAGVLIAMRLPRASRRARLALLGAAFLGGFVVVRAASMHHVDALLGLSLGPARLNWMLEMGGIACIALAAGGLPGRRPGILPRDVKLESP